MADDSTAYLITRRDNVRRQIAELSKQNYDLPNSPAPTNINLTGKIDSLYKELANLDKLIAQADGGFETYVEYDSMGS